MEDRPGGSGEHDIEYDIENDVMNNMKHLEKSSSTSRKTIELVKRLSCRFFSERLCSMVCSYQQQQLGKCSDAVCVCY